MRNCTGLSGTDLILDHFKQRRRHGSSRGLYNVAYSLMRIILQRRDFDSVEELIEFCGDPDSLRPWLSIEADRIIFAHELVQGIHKVTDEYGAVDSGRPTTADVKV